MLIEQIIKEAETFTDVFQLFAKYPEYQRLFATNYAKVRNLNPGADEASVVGQAQELTSQELARKNIKLTNQMDGREVVNRMRQDDNKSIQQLRQDLNNITQKAQADQQRNLQNQRAGADVGKTYSDNFYGNQYTGSLGRGKEKTIRDRLAGDSIDAFGDIRAAMKDENPGLIQGYSAGKNFAKALGQDFSRLPGSNLARALMKSGDTRMSYRPQYSK